MMLKSFKYRLYPTYAQSVLLEKHFGCVRFVYNLALETKIAAYSLRKTHLSRFDLQGQLPELKKECPWLKDVCSNSLQVALLHLEYAYKNFFEGACKFPKFKKKSAKKSFTTPVRIFIKNDKVCIPKFREGIKIQLHRPFEGDIKSATISKSPSGKYFISILCKSSVIDTPQKKPICRNSTIGVDLGIIDFLVCSNNDRISNPKYLRKSISKLKFLQRKYSKFKGKKTKIKLIREYEKVSNKRNEFLHQTSTKLIRENQSIAIEDLNVSGMLKNHSLALSISDAGWSNFVSMLEYKSLWTGVNLLKIGRFSPSSKMCSTCGRVNKELTLKMRQWTCECGISHDRDINAAINIKNIALSDLSVGRRCKSHK